MASRSRKRERFFSSGKRRNTSSGRGGKTFSRKSIHGLSSLKNPSRLTPRRASPLLSACARAVTGSRAATRVRTRQPRASDCAAKEATPRRPWRRRRRRGVGSASRRTRRPSRRRFPFPEILSRRRSVTAPRPATRHASLPARVAASVAAETLEAPAQRARLRGLPSGRAAHRREQGAERRERRRRGGRRRARARRRRRRCRRRRRGVPPRRSPRRRRGRRGQRRRRGAQRRPQAGGPRAGRQVAHASQERLQVCDAAPAARMLSTASAAPGATAMARARPGSVSIASAHRRSTSLGLNRSEGMRSRAQRPRSFQSWNQTRRPARPAGACPRRAAPPRRARCPP